MPEHALMEQRGMRVGIDFDNTIANYDLIFVAAAQAQGWIARGFRGNKRELRDVVRLLANGEIKWQMLQAEVYGARMGQATPFPGVSEFFRAARKRGFELYIVSHKTRFARYDPGRVDLREAALRWLETHGLLDRGGHGVTRDQVFFEDTRADKVARIGATGCAVFIDDLAEVLVDPAFPPGIERLLFSTSREALPSGTVFVCGSWEEIGRHILHRPELAEPSAVAARLAGGDVCSITPAPLGGNNRLYRVETTDGDVFALKAYPRQEGDPRDRLGTEYGALSFMHRHGIAVVPRPIAADADAGYGLYEWIEGAQPPADARSLSAAIAFLHALNRVRSADDAAVLPFASEACLSAGEIVAQVDRRLAALTAVADEHRALATFLRMEIRYAWARVVTTAREGYARAGLPFDAPIALAQRRLSPSDFGLHNALTRHDGTITFLDFEYFGWDDPAKLCCDFVLHPGMHLTEELQQSFLQGVSDIFAADPDFLHRLRACLPLYAVRWTAILLNEFLPERWQRRRAAGWVGERADVLRQQLDKARVMLARAMSAEERTAS